MAEVTPKDLENVANAIDEAADNSLVQSAEKVLVPQIPKHVRGILYESGKWIGIGGTVGLVVAGALEGTPALFVAAIGAVLLAASNFLAKANLS
ncbi:hypothetical protein [Frigoribacterium sp. CG_9.8]|uniref:hypothetical protein n=1 Tax=Frigoribacterium sp. CG_9.8 TaxID=2787733 RepID=UPI0018CAB4C5|nr:hypothetical protein [Frigoribacterium sp. CG_9.8]MBG6106625.1 hypothetical protein [Frigoribacterium sp. CG_9.8]